MVRSHAIQWLPIAAEDPAPGTFQAVVTALKHPGAAVHLPQPDSLPWPLNSASAALLATWVNPETPVWTDLCWDSDPAAWLQQTCACSLVTEPCMARVAFVADPLRIPPLGQFCLGEDDGPESFTTLILQVPVFLCRTAGFETCPAGAAAGSCGRPGSLPVSGRIGTTRNGISLSE